MISILFRDFPYNREDDDFKWFSTVGARATFKIFQDNLIVSALSFHAGMETIGYNWGSYNHMTEDEQSTESPDHMMYQRISYILQEQSHVEFLEDIPVGPMTDTIYAWYGSLDDWAYGQSWDTVQPSLTDHCDPTTYQPFDNEEYFTDIDHIQTELYIVEASNQKDPSENLFGDNYDVSCNNCRSDGYINRYIRMWLAFIDLSQPYEVVAFPHYHPHQNMINIFWKINGCLTLNEVIIEVKRPGTDFVPFSKIYQGGFCNWEGIQTEFVHTIYSRFE